jgi:branched-chain amino acid transport system substrate-binding protein
MRMRGWIGAMAAVLVALVLALGPAPAAAQEQILVGASLAMSGPFAEEVAPFKKLMEVWADMINAKGGIRLGGRSVPIKFIVHDDASKPDESIKVYERLVTVDKVHILVGPYSSPITIQASTVAEKHGIPMIALEANSTAIFNRGYKWLVGVIDDGHKWSDHYFEMLKADGKVKTMAIVIQETGHTKEVGAGAIAKAKAVGIQVVIEESAPARPPDFTPIIAKMKAANPDLVYSSGFAGFSVAFYKQALEQGLNPRTFHVVHHGSAFRKAVGEAQANHVSGENYWMPGIKRANWQMFEEMLQKTGITVADYPWAGIRMFGLDALKATLEKAGSLDRAKLMAAAQAVDVETISGRLRIRKKGEGWDPKAEGQGSMNPFPTQIQGGNYVTVWPPEIATGKHIYPRPAR